MTPAPNIGIRCERCHKAVDVYWRRSLPIPRFCGQACGNRGKGKRLAPDFWTRVDKAGPTPSHRPELGPCWVWLGALSCGYGSIKVPGSRGTMQTHRRAWQLTHGSIPPGLHVLHACDNPRCVNPTHLFLGTNADNIEDRVAKGRYHGEQTWIAKLTEAEVREVRRLIASGLTDSAIARRLNSKVSPRSIGQIRSGKAWRRVA